MNTIDILKNTRIIPITVLKSVKDALETAEILIENSINILEITLRTEIAFKCIQEVTKNFPELLVGSGSVLSRDALKQAIESGAKFAVSPALDLELTEYAISKDITFAPGINTPSELNSALKLGLKLIKVFPASNLGGPDYIKAITAPFRMYDFHLIPTGGINEKNISDYLRNERVIACGASYITDSKLIEEGKYDEIGNRIKKFKDLIANFNI